MHPVPKKQAGSFLQELVKQGTGQRDVMTASVNPGPAHYPLPQLSSLRQVLHFSQDTERLKE